MVTYSQIRRMGVALGAAYIMVAVFAVPAIGQSAVSSSAEPEQVSLPTGDDVRLRPSLPAGSSEKDDANVIPLFIDVPGIGGRTISGPSLRAHPRITSTFGWRSDPMGQGSRMHSGVDVAAPYGTPVRPSIGGRVVRSGWAGGYGIMVEIDHGGGLITRYGHLSQALVYTGQMVGVDTTIGLVGSTGRSTGSHLHYEMRVNDRPIDPVRASNGANAVPPASPGSLVIPGWVPQDQPTVAARSDWQNTAQSGELPQAIIR